MTTIALRLRIDLSAERLALGRNGGPEPGTSPPPGAPRGFREHLARALDTTDPEVLAAAEADYRGVYESEHAYIAEQVVDHLQPPDMSWVLACCEPAKLREGYQGRALKVWSIALHPGARMIFESVREPPAVLGASVEVEVEDREESPCPHCGAHDWAVFVHADDTKLTPLGCDRCLKPGPR